MRMLRWLAGGIAVAALLIGTLFWMSMAPRATVEAFIQHVREGDREAALAQMSSGSLARLGDETIWRFALGMGIAEVERATWSGASVFPGERRLKGVLHRSDGARQPFEALLTREDGAWRLVGMLTEDPAHAARALEIPGPGTAHALVHTVSVAVAESKARGDMQPVLAMMTPQAWQAFGIDDLNEAFADILQDPEALDWLHEARPQLAGRPSIPFPESVQFEGYYLGEPGELHFSYTFLADGGEWKLSGLELELR